MWTIAARELRSLFFSPLAWIILGIVQFILGLIFTIQLNQFLQPEMQAQIAQAPEAPGLTYFIVGQLYIWVGILLLFVIPALTMRLISEERRQYTLPLLFSAPIS
ncbi:MAG: ABC transporter permease, partial [Pseudomonadota bacterium]|nr:ABC transporter permease [Pseudomonadota bacterium]